MYPVIRKKNLCIRKPKKKVGVNDIRILLLKVDGNVDKINVLNKYYREVESITDLIKSMCGDPLIERLSWEFETSIYGETKTDICVEIRHLIKTRDAVSNGNTIIVFYKNKKENYYVYTPLTFSSHKEISICYNTETNSSDIVFIYDLV